MNSEKKIYLFANWKMYLNHTESVVLAQALAEQPQDFYKKILTVIFPSALSAVAVGQAFKQTKILFGAQNTNWVPRGGVTGEISAEMFAGIGAKYALIGHSERRHMFHETDHEVRQKVEAALAAGIIPVVCVGETAHERDNDKTEEVLEVQLRAAFEAIVWPKEIPLIVAYEPVWAISKGTEPTAGTPCEPNEAEKNQALIYKFLDGLVPKQEQIILYGGSVRPHNVKEYLNEPHINGVLVGAASTKLDSFLEIINHIQN